LSTKIIYAVHVADVGVPTTLTPGATQSVPGIECVGNDQEWVQAMLPCNGPGESDSIAQDTMC
jgi:hypothetical protein